MVNNGDAVDEKALARTPQRKRPGRPGRFLEELHYLRCIREEFEDEVALRVPDGTLAVPTQCDANQGLTCDDSPIRVEIMRTALAAIGSEFESITYFGDAAWDRRACDTLGWRFHPVGPGLGGIISYDGIEI